jgi:hypothetical protein
VYSFLGQFDHPVQVNFRDISQNDTWHPFWPFQSSYLSAQLIDEQWPFTVSEARLVCAGSEMLLEASTGTFGLTSHALSIDYPSLEGSSIWKYDPNGWQGRLPAEKFWLYVNTLCK